MRPAQAGDRGTSPRTEPLCHVTRLVSRDDCRSSETGSIPVRGATRPWTRAFAAANVLNDRLDQPTGSVGDMGVSEDRRHALQASMLGSVTPHFHELIRQPLAAVCTDGIDMDRRGPLIRGPVGSVELAKLDVLSA